jgi:hypothetical protein
MQPLAAVARLAAAAFRGGIIGLLVGVLTGVPQLLPGLDTESGA